MQSVAVGLIIAIVVILGARKAFGMLSGKDKPCNCENGNCQCCKHKSQV